MPKTKVHPNVSTADPVLTVTTCGARAFTGSAAEPDEAEEPPTVLTVWRRSLLFNCDGFTVYDARGDLAFRVDSYDGSGRRRDEVVLMDATGIPLLTVRLKRSLGVMAERWIIYDGDAATADAEAEKKPSNSKPLLSVRHHRRASLSKAKALAYVKPVLGSSSSSSGSRATAEASYVVEGSYGRRACVVRDHAREDAVVAEVRRKEAVVGLGDDVFRLVVAPSLGTTLAMGIVIALDEMFAGGRSSARSSSLLRSRTWSV